jgi:hypothetical protein
MRRLVGKVTGPPSLLQDTHSFADFFVLVCVALTAKLEAIEKALVEEKAARLVADQFLMEERSARLVADQSLRTF